MSDELPTSENPGPPNDGAPTTDPDPTALRRQSRIEREAEERAPVEQAGGGEAEGFEQAEEALIEQAEGGRGGHPLGDQFPVEENDVSDHVAHGEADDATNDSAEEGPTGTG